MKALVFLLSLTCLVHAQEFREIEFLSSGDQTKQKAIFFAPKSEKPVPMVVALHTWSGGYKQQHHKQIAEWCVKKGWAYLHPDFRGPAKWPEATGSELVIKDIVSSVAYAQKNAKIDPKAIYLVGTSGGGYHCLVMAGKHPELWAGVSAWASISDLTAWYHDNIKSGRRYWQDIVQSCGGKPGESPEIDKQYRQRSPVTYLANAKGKVRLHIATGITDGHTGSVPISHSLLAFNEVAEKKDQVSKEQIAFFVKEAKVPAQLAEETVEIPSYGKKQPLFERTSSTATVTIFNGGHEIIQPAAIAWMEGLEKERLAKPE